MELGHATYLCPLLKTEAPKHHQLYMELRGSKVGKE